MKAGMAGAAVLAGTMATAIALADADDGARFLNSCKSVVSHWDGRQLTANDNIADMGYCVGVVHGVRGALQFVSGGVKDGYPRVCLTEKYLEQEGVRTVVKFLEEHPDKLKYKDVLITMLALSAAYPCK
jgi:putative intracellular protease/amidase